MTLRLGQLPDRTPVRMSLSVDPELASALTDYAEIYRQTYGHEEKPETLIPAMIESFLASDAGFKRARRALIVFSCAFSAFLGEIAKLLQKALTL